MKIPSYRLHKATGQAVCTIGGHDHYLGKHGTPESDQKYRQLISRFLAGQPLDDHPESSSPPMKELIAQWWLHADHHYRLPDGAPKKEHQEHQYALAPLRRLHGSTLLEKFSPEDLLDVARAMVTGSWLTDEEKSERQKDGKKTTCCRRVANRRLTRIKTALRWLGRKRLIPGDILHQLLVVKGIPDGEALDYEDVPPVSEEDLAATLPGMGPILRALVEFQLLVACRPGEAVRVRPMDFDHSGRIKIARGWTVQLGNGVWAIQPDKHKNAWRGHRRIILVGPQAQAVIAPLLSGRAPEAYLFSPREASEEFMRRAGRRVNHARARAPGESYTVSAYDKAVKKACKRAGVESWAPNQLRHLAATRLVEQWGEWGWELARQLLGHKSVETTKRYVLTTLKKAAEAVGQVG